MNVHSRRDLFKILALLGALGFSFDDLTAKPNNFTGDELIIQVKNGEQNAILFYNISKNTFKILNIPYQIHDILPIKNNQEFILTAKGGYLFHVDRVKIIASLKSPKDIMFYGHSSYDPKSELIYTSSVQVKGYDHLPRRKAKQVFKDDKTFLNGLIYVISIKNLKIKKFFSSSGYMPHDQKIIENDKLFVLNSGSLKSPKKGYVGIFALNTGELLKSFSCDESQKYCPMAHMSGDNKRLAIIGVSNSANMIYFDGSNVRKTTLEKIDNKKYRSGEMLNASFNKSKNIICSMNIDNGFLGTWDFKTGRVITYKFLDAIVSVDTYKDYFLATTPNSFNYYNDNLKIEKIVTLKEVGLKNYIIYGPHSRII